MTDWVIEMWEQVEAVSMEEAATPRVGRRLGGSTIHVSQISY